MNTIKHYLIKFRRARSLETLNRQADLADERNPDDHKAINEAWNQRYLELTSRVDSQIPAEVVKQVEKALGLHDPDS